MGDEGVHSHQNGHYQKISNNVFFYSHKNPGKNIYYIYLLHHHKETIKQEKRLSWVALYGDFEKAALGKRTARRLMSED